MSIASRIARLVAAQAAEPPSLCSQCLGPIAEIIHYADDPDPEPLQPSCATCPGYIRQIVVNMPGSRHRAEVIG